MKRLFGTDGVRGVANEELTPELAMRLAQATAQALKGEGKCVIFVGMDTRLSSPMLRDAIISGLCASGAEAVDLGVLPTPGVAYLTKKHHADAGVVISASHNSFEHNGIKIFNSEGYKLADEIEEQIEALVSSPDRLGRATHDKIGTRRNAYELRGEYLDYLRSICTEGLEGLKIALDCANGATSALAEELFTSLGADCRVLHCEPNGININEGCGSTHIEKMSDYVVKNQLNAGIAFDGDGDRLMCVNERGEVVDGDMIMASLAYDMKKRGALVKNTVVGTIMTNLGFDVFCRENGISFIPARVGDRYVLEEMLLGGYCFGGEQSGHLIFSDHSTTGDGMLSAIMLLSLMKRKNLPLSTLHSVMRRYPQALVNIEADKAKKLEFLKSKQIADILEEAKQGFGERGRVVARPSGTEPLIRIMVECDGDAEKIANEIAEKIRAVL
ncbi:MAG: phosphoglucosamine mutase [Clostridia bacterium]|nr:phosphoglucosamine mutase [Clostridia bacterium]